MDYWILLGDAPDCGLIDAYPAGGPAGYLYDRGAALASRFPRDATVRFSANFPEARRLADFQPNTLRALLVSPRVRDVLAKAQVEEIEYLPVTIRDHRDEVIGRDYAFLNPLGSQEAIDMDRSKYRMGSLDKTQIDRVKDLVLRRQSIAPGAKLFRCRHYLRLFLVRDDVATALQAAGLTGFRLVEPDGWDGLEV